VLSDTDLDLGERLKAAFRRHPAGVAIISAATPTGPVGLTASSVASVSTAPPALSFSVMGSRSAQGVLTAASFVVNLLGSGHADLAHDFAHSGRPRFTDGQGWDVLPTGEPVLTGAPAALRCVPLHRLPVGESTLVVAEVRAVLLGPAGPPLIYHQRTMTSEPVRPPEKA
jgi:flavin reductase (DIM6/NTAB) family NADH-FMN oxidoreductase RutF